MLRSIAAKAVYSACCVAAASTLVVSNYARTYVSGIMSIGTSNAIQSGPSVGEQNILVMGLESRTDYNGNILPADLLAALHAGSVQGVENGVGGQDTNTLILIHIFNGGKKAVGWSIPRDDWVTYPATYDGQSQGKIDQAYGDAWAQSLSQTSGNSGMSKTQRYFQANEAGQAATVATVESLTGEHIDHFAEVNLAGFYELAKAFGGIMVCIKPYNGGQNLHDANSGFRARHAGYLHLAADQALAFVRERDNLPNGDIDRTYRQQAVIDYVMWKLKHQNVLSDLGQLKTLLNTAKQYVITDAGWNLLDFSTEMRSLTGKNLSFATAPIVTFQTIEGQAANVIDPNVIKQDVQSSFASPSAATGGTPASHAAVPPYVTTVDVLNGGQTAGLASRVSGALIESGFRQGQVGNATAQSATQVLYGTGTANAANAAKIAAAFGVAATASASVTAGHVEIILGASTTTVPDFGGSSPSSSPSATAAATPTPSSSATSASGNGSTGGPISVSPSARFGIPCVY
jgi:LCP family protein required for cell wall assembly